MKSIAIIGAGFSGTMTAIHLTQQAESPLEIYLIGDVETFNRGTAYTPYSKDHLLNVVAGRMSAFPDKPDHFVNWITQLPEFNETEVEVISTSFLPRRLFGNYLDDLWKGTLSLAKEKEHTVHVLHHHVVDANVDENSIRLKLDNSDTITVDCAVIATGNHPPGNPVIKNAEFYTSPHYFRNPWTQTSVENTDPTLPVLLIGNGLSMADTILGLLEHGFTGQIYSISPNGFNILPHKNNPTAYTGMDEELHIKMSLLDLLKLVHKHIRSARHKSIDAGSVIDALQPHTQNAWKRFTDNEKKFFIRRIRHLWNGARHRLPLQVYEILRQLRQDSKLEVIEGRIIDMQDKGDYVQLDYYDKKQNVTHWAEVSRVINCSGPESDIMLSENNFLKACIQKGMFMQDPLHLGLETHTDTYQLQKPSGEYYPNFFTLGPTLRGMLWETTAVNELRQQAQDLALILINTFSLKDADVMKEETFI